MNNTYNGWANYHTWNVSLYINNEYPLYKAAESYVAYQTELNLPVSYTEFTQYYMDLLGTITPDGVSWTDPSIDEDEMNEMLMEFAN